MMVNIFTGWPVNFGPILSILQGEKKDYGQRVDK